MDTDASTPAVLWIGHSDVLNPYGASTMSYVRALRSAGVEHMVYDLAHNAVVGTTGRLFHRASPAGGGIRGGRSSKGRATCSSRVWTVNASSGVACKQDQRRGNVIKQQCKNGQW